MQLIFITTCKPFIGDDIAWKQEQSMESWTQLDGKGEIDIKIVVVGNDRGVKEICDKYGFIHRPDVKKRGPVPYLTSMLNIGYEYGSEEDIFFWTNSDMAYGQDLIDTIIEFKKINNDTNYMLVGQRWDWEKPRLIKNIIDPDNLKLIISESKLHATCGIDYIIHSKTTMIDKIDSSLVIAGTRHDMIMLGIGIENVKFNCDVTKTITTIHHDHHRNYQNTSEFKQRINNNYKCKGRIRNIHECSKRSNIINGEIKFT